MVLRTIRLAAGAIVLRTIRASFFVCVHILGATIQPFFLMAEPLLFEHFFYSIFDNS